MCLVERNRAPFDLLEGESELIRGFNIELSSLLFILLFLREYGMLVSLRIFFAYYVLGLTFVGLLRASLLLFVRSCYPRVRYDSMIRALWKELLPLVTILFVLTVLC